MSLDHKIAEVRTLLDKVQADYAPAVFANSFGAEDMVLTDIIARHYPGIGMFTLDTGRLPEETYSLMREVADRYGIRVPVYFPDSAAVEAYVAQNGPNGFYDSVELRKNMLPYSQSGTAETCLARKARMDYRSAPRSGADQKGSELNRNLMLATVCKKSVHCWTGVCPMSGLISNNSMSPITRCMTKGTQALAARPVLVPLLPARMFVPDAGGGKTRKSRSAVCIRTSGALTTPQRSFGGTDHGCSGPSSEFGKERAWAGRLIKPVLRETVRIDRWIPY